MYGEHQTPTGDRQTPFVEDDALLPRPKVDEMREHLDIATSTPVGRRQ